MNFRPAALLCVLLSSLAVEPRAWADLDETGRSAAALLKDATRLYRSGQHHSLLRSLRHLRDPRLEPLFAQLAENEHPAMRVHGVMGLAELSNVRKLDLARLAAIKELPVQAEVVGGAMQAGLLDAEGCQQLMEWKDVDPGVKVVVALKLVQLGKFKDTAWLKRVANTDVLGRKGMAGLMLLQLGDAEGQRVLQEVDAAEGPSRDQVRIMLLQSAARFELDRAGPWAMDLAGRDNVTRNLGLAALQTALRFQAPGAVELWRREFTATDNPAQRNRLALLVLHLSHQLPPEVFDTVISSSDTLVQQMGRAGKAVASGKGIVDAVVQLIEARYLLANAWALEYAELHADVTTAQQVLLALVLVFEGTDRDRARRFDDAVRASELLAVRSIDGAIQYLQPLLKSSKTDAALKRAILLGLLNLNEGDPQRVVQGVGDMGDHATNDMALLLRARGGDKLSTQEMEHLSLLARGGGQIPESLRVQAAWNYLVRTNQTKEALAVALKD